MISGKDSTTRRETSKRGKKNCFSPPPGIESLILCPCSVAELEGQGLKKDRKPRSG